jgi:hypothetical protein
MNKPPAKAANKSPAAWQVGMERIDIGESPWSNSDK